MKTSLFATHVWRIPPDGHQVAQKECGCHDFDVLVFKTLIPDPYRRSPLTCHEGGFILWVRLVSNSHLLGFIALESLGRGHWHGCHNESNQSSVIGRVLWLPSDSHFERLKLGPWGWQLMNIDTLDIVKLLHSNVNEVLVRKVCIHSVL